MEGNIRAVVLRQIANEIAYYSKLQKRYRFWYQTLGAVQIVLASVIPLVAIFGENCPEAASRVAAVLGTLIAIVKGFDSFFQTRESWIRFSRTAVRLQTELESFNAQSGAYAELEDLKASKLLQEKSIAITREETDTWTVDMNKNVPGTSAGGAAS